MLAETAANRLTTNEPDRIVEFNIEKNINIECGFQLMQIAIDQLFHNAWKFTAEKEEAVINFGSKQNGRDKVIFISDNGIGFEPGKATELFLPFAQCHDKTVEGFGLGLATVERIVHCYGGRIWAESEPGEGATFYFTMNS